MKINVESELMKNQKHAKVMAPDKKFAVLQSAEGDSLFFSIGDGDGLLYLTREGSHLRAGWDKISVVDSLTKKHDGGTAKTFEVSQDADSGMIDLAVAFTVGKADLLYISQGHSNSDFDWAKGVEWTNVAFDGPATQVPVQIADIYHLQLPSQTEAQDTECFVVDLTKSSDPLGFYDRYYITPSASQKWNPHTLPSDMTVKQSNLGKSAKGLVHPGVYTLGKDAGGPVLEFRALHGFYKEEPPTVARLVVPNGATAIATALDGDGNTNLFVAGNNSIYLFPPDNLFDEVSGQCIIQNAMLTGVQLLHAQSGTETTSIWGVTDGGKVFHVQCALGNEASPAAWSYPVPLFQNVQTISPFLNRTLNQSVIFGYTQNQQLIQITQDPTSAQWRQRNILLPPTAVADMVEYTSFTTHIKITDDNTVPIPNSKVAITASTRVGVYLNDEFQVLSDVPVNATTDVTGSLTIVQETQTLSAVAYHVTAQSAANDVNPMDQVMGKVGDVQDGPHLENVKVTNPDGSQHYLLPEKMPDRANKAAATAAALKQFALAAKTMRPNSSDKHTSRSRKSSAGAPVRVFGVSYTGGSCQFHEGDAAIARFGVHFKSPAATTDPSLWLSDESTFELFWEDAWDWFMSIVHEVTEWFAHVAEDVWHFFVQLGTTIYKVVVDCVSAVVRAVQFVFHKIEVFFEDLIKWLGFIFEWQDILRTHKVAKRILLLYAQYALNRVGKLETDVVGVCTGLEAEINSWAGITGTSETVGSYQARSSTVKGHDSPGSNWALHHAKSNLASATSKVSSHPLMLRSPGPVLAGGDDIYTQLKELIDSVLSDFKDAITEIKTNIIDPISGLTATQIIKSLSGIVGKLVVKIAKDLILGVLKIAKDVVGGLLDILTTELQIPILTPIYAWLTKTKENPKGDALTFLDLGCLIAAIPATIIFKLINEQTPFPDNAFTQSLIDATDIATLREIFSSKTAAERDAAQLAPIDIINSVGNFVALYGALTVALFSGLKYAAYLAEEPVPGEVYAAAFTSSLPYILPDIVEGFAPGWNTRWPIMNDTVAAVWLVKTGVDNIPQVDANKIWSTYDSPLAECVINAVWLAPDIGTIIDTQNRKDSDWVGFGANVSFDLSGILLPFTKKEVTTPDAAPMIFVADEVLVCAYGILSAVVGGLVAAGK
jgi:hypothetical protein